MSGIIVPALFPFVFFRVFTQSIEPAPVFIATIAPTLSVAEVPVDKLVTAKVNATLNYSTHVKIQTIRRNSETLYSGNRFIPAIVIGLLSVVLFVQKFFCFIHVSYRWLRMRLVHFQNDLAPRCR